MWETTDVAEDFIYFKFMKLGENCNCKLYRCGTLDVINHKFFMLNLIFTFRNQSCTALAIKKSYSIVVIA